MEISRDDWFSEVLEKDAYRTTVDSWSSEGAIELTNHFGGKNSAFYYTKIPVSDVEAVAGLGRSGFYVVDVNVDYSLIPGKASLPEKTCIVRPMEPSDGGAILDIAGSTFRYTRFHLDHAISNTHADKIKREWMRSYVEGRRGLETLVAEKGSEVVGFLAVLALSRNGQDIRRIDLIGVKRGCERQGIGRSLVIEFVARHRNLGVLEVGTQLANVPSIRLYENLGFLFSSATYVLHKHLTGTGSG